MVSRTAAAAHRTGRGQADHRRTTTTAAAITPAASATPATTAAADASVVNPSSLAKLASPIQSMALSSSRLPCHRQNPNTRLAVTGSTTKTSTPMRFGRTNSTLVSLSMRRAVLEETGRMAPEGIVVRSVRFVKVLPDSRAGGPGTGGRAGPVTAVREGSAQLARTKAGRRMKSHGKVRGDGETPSASSQKAVLEDENGRNVVQRQADEGSREPRTGLPKPGGELES